MIKRRNTRQRQMILDVVRNRKDHPTVEQIYEEVKTKNKNISLGTVYRNLAVLTEDKAVLNLRFKDYDRYDFCTVPHNHFECKSCGQVFDICVAYDSALDNKVSEDGFLITSHTTVFTGLCPECLKKKNITTIQSL